MNRALDIWCGLLLFFQWWKETNHTRLPKYPYKLAVNWLDIWKLLCGQILNQLFIFLLALADIDCQTHWLLVGFEKTWPPQLFLPLQGWPYSYLRELGESDWNWSRLFSELDKDGAWSGRFWRALNEQILSSWLSCSRTRNQELNMASRKTDISGDEQSFLL